jgi:hypothetical protein
LKEDVLREQDRLRILNCSVLRRRFGSKRDEGTAGWRKLLNKELHNLYCLSDIVRVFK